FEDRTEVTEFILLEIPHTEGLEAILFVIFLIIYLLTLLGNSLILLAIISSSHLYTPMYFFLGLLSIFDIFFPSVSCPKMLLFLSGNSQTISYRGCASQLFFYHFVGCTEGILYSLMSYDCFVAICHPLWYTVIMNPRLCVALATCNSLIGCIHATILTSLTFQLPYCGLNEVDYYFCDIPSVISLACADNSLVQRVSFTNVGLLTLTFFTIIVSCTHIGIAILSIHSAEGRSKAFSTCSAHLTAIMCAFGPIIIIYFQYTPKHLLGSVVQILNNIVSPMLNSFIYSLRNKEVKRALKRVLCRIELTSEV
ncbi:olfactory receptor 10N1-like, partial [Macrotis lagotis]|uniref:olfactory receptor 10N1-like n=1 Tax=Macrotis lagotis TaxID=92651 RepID=UPI003D6805C8